MCRPSNFSLFCMFFLFSFFMVVFSIEGKVALQLLWYCSAWPPFVWFVVVGNFLALQAIRKKFRWYYDVQWCVHVCTSPTFFCLSFVFLLSFFLLLPFFFFFFFFFFPLGQSYRHFSWHESWHELSLRRR